MNLLDRTTKLRVRRIFRRRQRQVEAAAEAAGTSLDTEFIGRFDRLLRVRRFAFGWLALAVLVTVCTIVQTVALSGQYQTAQPAPGGIYNEGIVGTYSNANPVFATGAVDVTISKLIFAGLFKYDEHNQLVGDLASGYTLDSTGRRYTVTLRPGLTWQDGQALTAKDVAFTYHLIQNPDVGSPLIANWQNITVAAPNDHTITFSLPNVYAGFPYSLLTGIVPEHLLAGVPAAQVRSEPFNTIRPVGAGPFAWQAIQVLSNADPDKAVSLIALQPFHGYVGGAPRLSGFVLHAYGSRDVMIAGFQRHDINAMAGLTDMPAVLSKARDVRAMDFGSTAAVMTFFKTASGGVLADKDVRRALVQGANTTAILDNLPYATRPVREPFLLGQLGYDAGSVQASYNRTAANSALDAAGWVRGKDGIRSKNSTRLAFRLYAEDTPEYRGVTKALVRDWTALGAEVTPVLQSDTDIQTTVQFQAYQALLYGISIGVDPDVFPYWDSSQADVRSALRLNFSEYSSKEADTALEAGRTRLDPALRAIKYQPFLKAWQADAPALGLYQPRILYITRGTVYGLNEHVLNIDSDRYGSVAEWQIRTVKVTN